MITRSVVLFVVALSLFGAQPETKPVSNKIVITVAQLIALGQVGSLQRLEQQSFPPLLSLRIHRLGAVVDPEINRVTQEQAKMFTEQNSSIVDADGGKKGRQIKPEYIKDFQAKMAPFLAERIELPVIPIELSDLPADTKMSAWDIEVLGPLIHTGDEQEKSQESKK